jgi:phosphopantetheinyl transferase (holo-ACP synthase)
MTNQARFTINSLSEGKSALVHITPVAGEGSFIGFEGTNGLGLEIENIAALPDAKDYSLHEFYQANFTPSEIAHCIKQPAVKAAFQGVLAAKRAIIKSGAAKNPPEGPRGVEISFDEDGRPTHPHCLLSISHTDTIAAAICFRLGALASPAAQSQPVQAQQTKLTFATRIFVLLVLLSLLFLFGLGTWKLLQYGLH